MPLTEAIKEAYACAPSNDAVLETLQINHPSIAGDIFLVRNLEDLTLTLEDSTTQVFTAAGFQISLPAKTNTGLQQLSIKIDNVDQRVSDFLNNAKNYKTPVILKYRPYLASDLTTPQYNPPLTLYLSDVKVTNFDVTGTANFADLINKKYPSERYTRARFPSLGG